MIRFQSNESRTKASLGFLEITPLPLPNRPICRVGNRHESFLIMLLNEIVIGLASPSIVENRARHISFPHGPFNGERGKGTTREIRGREREKKKRTGNGGRGERARFNAISRYNGDTDHYVALLASLRERACILRRCMRRVPHLRSRVTRLYRQPLCNHPSSRKN